MINPVPEPKHYVDAQVAAMADPSSARDTVLITPGTPMPSRIPPGAIVAQTRRGIVITTRPEKIPVIDSGTEEQVGIALFGYGYDQSKGGDMAAVASNAQGTPVAELATSKAPGQMTAAMQAAGLLAPHGGKVDLIPKKDAALRRLTGLLGG